MTYQVKNTETDQRCDFDTLVAATMHYYKLPGNVGKWKILQRNGLPLTPVDSSAVLIYLIALKAKKVLV